MVFYWFEWISFVNYRKPIQSNDGGCRVLYVGHVELHGILELVHEGAVTSVTVPVVAGHLAVRTRDGGQSERDDSVPVSHDIHKKLEDVELVERWFDVLPVPDDDDYSD